MKVPDGFTSVRTTTLNAKQPLEMDVFVPVAERPVRYAAAGDAMDTERLARLKKFRFSKILIRAEDEAKYRTFLDNVLKQAENTKKPLDERSAAMTASTDSAGEDLVKRVESAETYKLATKQFERFAQFLKANEGALDLVLGTFRDSPDRDHVSHGSFVGTLALALAEQHNLLKLPGSRAQLVAAAFLHDRPLELMNLPFRKAGVYTPEQETEWKEHPLKAAEALNGFPHFERLTLELIAQHEELPNGKGYPRSLNGKNMQPLAIPLSLANRFDHALVDAGPKPGEEFATTFKMAQLGIFDLDMVENLLKMAKKSGLIVAGNT